MVRGAAEDDSAGGREGPRMRGSNWSHEERVALMEAYGRIAFDPITGDSQSGGNFLERIETEFLLHSRCPAKEVWDGYPAREKTSWFGRGLRSCKYQASKMRKDCTAYRADYIRLTEMELTGNISDEGLKRAAAYLFDGGAAARGTARDKIYKIVVQAADAPKVKAFPFLAVYEHCMQKPSLRRLFECSKAALATGTPRAVGTSTVNNAGSCGPGQGNGEDRSIGENDDSGAGRPLGSKKAKEIRKRREEKRLQKTAVSDISKTLASYVSSKTQKTSANETPGARAARKASERSKQFNAYNILCSSASGFLEKHADKKTSLDGKMVNLMMRWMDDGESDDEKPASASEGQDVPAEASAFRVELDLLGNEVDPARNEDAPNKESTAEIRKDFSDDDDE